MAQIQLELVSVSKLLATAKAPNGEIVNFGYRKSANVISDLLGKPVGHKFTADLELSNHGRMYNTETIEVAEAYFKVEKMQKQRKVLDMQIAQFTV